MNTLGAAIEALNRGYGSTPELDQFRSGLRGYLNKTMPLARIRETLEIPGPKLDPQTWKSLADDQGLPALLIAEADGGLGASWQEMGAALEEVGRSLLPGPVTTSCVMASTVLVNSPSIEAHAWLKRLASGDATGALSLDRQTPAVRADIVHGRPSLRGDAGWVVDVEGSGCLIVAATNDETVSTYLLPTDAVTVEPSACFDLTHTIARVRLDGAPAAVIDDGVRALEAAHQAGVLALACEQAGAAQRALEITLAYVASRSQFGQPIGSFQAVKHRCVDLFVEVQAALLAVRAACRALAADSPEAQRLIATAALVAAETSALVGEETIQLHGGIGFTWEHECHLYLRRMKFAEQLLETPDQLRERVLSAAMRVSETQ